MKKSADFQEVVSDILVFIAVVNAGSLVGACEKLKLSKPSVSRKISELEDRLQLQLLKRTTRKITLTDHGRSLFNQCNMIPFMIDKAIQNVQENNASVHGDLKIGFASYYANDFNAMKLVADFVAINPKVNVQLHSFTKSEDVDPVKQEIDVYFTDTDLTSARLLSVPYISYPIRVCAARSYIDKFGEPQTISELAAHNCLLHYLYEKLQNEWYYYDGAEYTSIIVNGKVNASRTHFLAKLVRAGVGIALLPEFMVHKYVQKGELKYLLPQYRFRDSQIYITTYRNKNNPYVLKCFLDYIKQVTPAKTNSR